MKNTNHHTCFISTAQIADIETIVQFQIDMAQESEGTTLQYNKVLGGVTAAMNDASKGLYIIARIDNEAAGSLMLTREWSDWNNQWYWWIQSVYVKPQFRNNGIYRQMYAYVKKMALEEGVSQIRLYVDKTNHPALTVYEKLGMKECHYLMYEEYIK